VLSETRLQGLFTLSGVYTHNPIVGVMAILRQQDSDTPPTPRLD
jgi:hypothetical protein